MNSRQNILERCRNAFNETYERPNLDDINPLTFRDPLQQFQATSEAMGSRVINVKAGEDVNSIIKDIYPDAMTFASALPEIKIATINPDTVESAKDLNKTDVGIIRGEFGVAENGCIWVKQTMKERAVCFICENLVIMVPGSKMYSNMHEAYPHITFNENGYGVFICGPSKTADIAQVLVTGAQAARSVAVLIMPE